MCYRINVIFALIQHGLFVRRQSFLVLANKGEVSAESEAAFSKEDKFWAVMRKPCKGNKIDPAGEVINRIIAKVCAKFEHSSCVIKRQFGHVKTRYRGADAVTGRVLLLCFSRTVPRPVPIK